MSDIFPVPQTVHSFKLQRQVVHIPITPLLLVDISHKKNGISLLRKSIKIQHFEKFGQPLHIQTKSLELEILLHIYGFVLSERMLRPHNPFLQVLRPFFSLIRDRSCVIDCGEKKEDRNRWVYDGLSPFYLLIFPPVQRHLGKLIRGFYTKQQSAA